MANMQSIGKYADVIYNIKHQTYYVETLEDGTVITDETRKLPVVDFVCTVKLHGTFAGVRYRDGVVTAMSKGNDITVGKDNAGFAQFVENNREYFEFYLSELADSLELEEVSLMGEFVGKGIQKGVGINLIKDKTFIVFGIKFKQKDQDPRWAQLPHEILRQISDKDFRIRSIFEFQHEVIKIDFNHPEKALAELDKLKDKIEMECPVAKAILEEDNIKIDENEPLVGEGIVCVGFTPDGERYIFKHKGEKHSKANKVRQPKENDPLAQEKLELAEVLTPGWRLNQAIQETGAETLKDTGAVIKWVLGDILKEEMSTFRESNFGYDEVKKYITKIVADWYKQKILDDALGN
jgi:hypothetical protein